LEQLIPRGLKTITADSFKGSVFAGASLDFGTFSYQVH